MTQKRKNRQHDSHIRRHGIRKCRNCSEYEKKGKGGGRRIRVGLERLKAPVPAVWNDTSDDDKAALLCLSGTVFCNHPCRAHVTYVEMRPGSVSTCGLKRIPSKSSLHCKAQKTAGGMGRITALLPAQAGDDARGTLMGDPSGFPVMRYGGRGMPRKASHPGVNLTNCTS